MAKTKKALMISITLVFMFLFCISLTLAYLTDNREVSNQLVFGNVKVALKEVEWDKALGANKKLVVVPNKKYAKDPVVHNVGNVPCVVRATVTISNMKEGSMNQQNLSDYIQLGTLGKYWAVAPGNTWNDKKVTLYYLQIIMPETASNAIFEDFTILPEVKGVPLHELEGKNTEFDINVKVEAIQAEGIDALAGKTKLQVEDLVAAFGQVANAHDITTNKS